jgi:DNA polymerase/3'-5' exonuclease PolX
MGDKTRIPLAGAEALAAEVVDLLAPWCVRIAVAGSIRRRRPTIGDIEIVCLPTVEVRVEQVDMFTTREVAVDLLHERCAALRTSGVFADRPDKNGHPAFGAKFKRLLFRGFALDVFSARPDNWGYTLLLRTGPAEWNKQLVLKQSQGGWLPRGYFFRDGQLWELPAPYDASLAYRATAVPTPEEADVFAALGYAFVPPEQRSDRQPAALAVPA